MKINDHLNLLGTRVRDRVTGFTGIVTTVSFDLYGCIQPLVNPGMNEKRELPDSKWFDSNRLEVLDSTPVMPRPKYEWTPEKVASGGKGPAEKPAAYKS